MSMMVPFWFKNYYPVPNAIFRAYLFYILSILFVFYLYCTKNIYKQSELKYFLLVFEFISAKNPGITMFIIFLLHIGTIT